MEKDYLDISFSRDLKNTKEKFLYRVLELFPGTLAWLTLAAVIFLSWLLPAKIAVFIIVFDLFWLLRVSYLSFHQIAGYRKMKENLKTNWLEKLETSGENWQKIHHLIFLSFYKESAEVLRPAFQSLCDADYPKEKMIVVLAAEERAGEQARLTAETIEREFGGKFLRFFKTVHPQSIPGELGGKGSNFAFAFREIKNEIDKLMIPKENILVSNFDSDTRPYPRYFSCLSWHFLYAENPLRTSFQPIPIYNNNIWEAPVFSRIIAVSGTFWQMMQQERQEQLISYSSHSLPFRVLEEVGYPHNMVSDDSRMFWKAYVFYDGDYRAKPLHYPVSMDAVVAGNFQKTAVNQYKQQRRWAWGCENIPYLMFCFYKNKKISFSEKLRHTFVIVEGFWSWGMVALLTFFLGWLPLWIGGQEFQTTMLSYNLPKITSYIMTMAMFGTMISAIMSMLLLPPKPKNFGRMKSLSMIFQWFFLPVTLIIFGSLPALESQTRLLVGKRLSFWPTEKFTKKKRA